MCMQRAPINRKRINVTSKYNKPKKRKTPFNKELMKPDPDFVDERIKKSETVSKEGLFFRFFG